MAVVATGYLGKALEATRDVLANCAQFQTMMGVATVAAAQAKVVLGFSRGNVVAPYADIVYVSAQSGRDTQRTEIRPTAQIVTIAWPVVKTEGDTDQDLAMRGINAYDTLVAQMRTLIGTSTYLMRADMDLRTPSYGKADNTELVDQYVAGMTISWEV